MKVRLTVMWRAAISEEMTALKWVLEGLTCHPPAGYFHALRALQPLAIV